MATTSLSGSIIRVLTALVGIPLVVYLTWLGGWPFMSFVLLCSLLGQYELYSMMAKAGMTPLRASGLVLGLLIGLRSVLPLPLVLGVAAVTVLLVGSHLQQRLSNPLQSVSVTLLGVLYPTTMLTYLVDIRTGGASAVGNENAFWLTLSVFVLVWVSDTAAYYVGRAFGRHSLAPQISPNKTWEGSVAGATGAIAAATGLGMTVLPFLSPLDCIALGVICGAIGQTGDLAESRIKRLSGVKDSGNILPGHGGVLDRFDAMTVAAPLAYFYLFYVAEAL